MRRFTVPVAQPGVYRISIVASETTYASTRYRVASSATLAISVTPDAGGDRLRITGARFVPRAHLLLVAYGLQRSSKPIVLGRTRADSRGNLRFAVTRRLRPGEYGLHVFATQALTADVASTYFQVEV